MSVKMAYFILIVFVSATMAQVSDNDGNWASKDTIIYNTPEADMMIRVGDIDNLGFGWPTDFDPFSGNNTPSHSYPWTADTMDPSGTDRIMVLTSYVGTPPAGQDGYTSSTSRPENSVRPITLHYDLTGIKVNSAVLQIFVDDFQAPVWKANYQVRFNGIRIPLMESIINALQQTGPIGKIISAQIPNEFLYLVKRDSLQILIDDYTTGAGDGYAIDFAKLLINPKSIAQVATVNGTVTDYNTGQPIDSVMVVANGVASDYTDSLGHYSIDSVLAGLVSVKTYKKGYGSQTKSTSVATGGTATVNFSLKSPAPFVTDHSPADSAYSITVDSTIQVWFSTALDTTSIETFTFYLADSSGLVSGNYIKHDSSVVFIPDTMRMNDEYVLTLTTGISDKNGISLDKEYSWRFFTYDKKPVTALPGYKNNETVPATFKLYPAYPNPFNPQTIIKYDLLEQGHVTLAVYSATGRLVQKLINKQQVAGNYSMTFNGDGLASGIYYIQLRVGPTAQSQKIVFLK